MLLQFNTNYMDFQKYLNCYISFCNFSHIKTNCWNHVFTKLTRLNKKRQVLTIESKKNSYKELHINCLEEKSIMFTMLLNQ